LNYFEKTFALKVNKTTEAIIGCAIEVYKAPGHGLRRFSHDTQIHGSTGARRSRVPASLASEHSPEVNKRVHAYLRRQKSTTARVAED
jgi:hypothetical protein